MKIFFFIESGLGVGALLCNQLSSIYKVNKDIIGGASTLEQEPNLLSKLKAVNIPIISFDSMEYHKNFWKHIRLLRSAIVKENVDVIHVQTNWQLIITFLAIINVANKPKVVFTIHAYRNNKNWMKKNIAKILIAMILFLFSDKVIASCQYIKKTFSLLGRRIEILHLGIDDAYINREFVKVSGSLKLVFPAQFREGKRQDIIIRAFKNYVLQTNDSDAQLILPGSGPLLEVNKKLAESLNITNQVFFPGLCSKEELLRIYDETNILVCSSKSETYCQSIVEGLSLGKCVLSTPVGIATEIIDNKNSGYIFRTEKELTDLLIMLNVNTSHLQKICENNYNNRWQYSWSSISQEYISLLQKILR